MDVLTNIKNIKAKAIPNMAITPCPPLLVFFLVSWTWNFETCILLPPFFTSRFSSITSEIDTWSLLYHDHRLPRQFYKWPSQLHSWAALRYTWKKSHWHEEAVPEGLLDLKNIWGGVKIVSHPTVCTRCATDARKLEVGVCYLFVSGHRH